MFEIGCIMPSLKDIVNIIRLILPVYIATLPFSFFSAGTFRVLFFLFFSIPVTCPITWIDLKWPSYEFQ